MRSQTWLPILSVLSLLILSSVLALPSKAASDSGGANRPGGVSCPTLDEVVYAPSTQISYSISDSGDLRTYYLLTSSDNNATVQSICVYPSGGPGPNMPTVYPSNWVGHRNPTKEVYHLGGAPNSTSLLQMNGSQQEIASIEWPSSIPTEVVVAYVNYATLCATAYPSLVTTTTTASQGHTSGSGDSGGCEDENETDSGCSGGSGGSGGSGESGGCQGGTNCGGGGGHGGSGEGWDKPGACWVALFPGTVASTSLSMDFSSRQAPNGTFSLTISGSLTSGPKGFSGQSLMMLVDGRVAGYTSPTNPDGTFSASINNVPVGAHTLTVEFPGDALYTASSSTGTFGGGPVDRNNNQPVGKGIAYPYGLVGNVSGSRIVAITGAGTCDIISGTPRVCEIIPYNWTATLLKPSMAVGYYGLSSSGHLRATYSTNIALSDLPDNTRGVWLIMGNGSLCNLNTFASTTSMPHLNFPSGLYANYGWYPLSSLSD